MKRFLKDYRLHEYTEALFLLTLGIIIQVLDGSPLDVKHRWTLAWETEFPREYFSAFIQKIIKTVLSMIILVRCLTSILYVLSGFVAAYCILRETSPKLMLPWLFISGVKSVLLTFLETLTGVYVCSSFGKIRKPCIEFVVSKAVELFFAIYLWACIRSIHKDMERVEEDAREEVLLTKMVIQRVNLRRRRARSMIDQTTLYKTANLNYFELKDVPNIIFDMLKTEEELSQDSLLSPGMMLASVSNMGSYDYLKTSLSLGELGFMDLNSFQVVGLDDDRRLCPYKRAMKFLKLTRDDIQKAKEVTRRDSFIQNYEAPEEIPWNIINSKHSTTHTKYQRQEEIFVAQLPDPDKVRALLKRKKRRQLPQDDILSEYDMLSEEESKASDEKIISLEEGEAEENGRDDVSLTISAETDGETTPDLWFMTNRKDEVNRIGLFETHTSKRADNYETLYKQDFMSDIGPEVFDKASKLVKLTSLSDINAKSSGLAAKAQTSYPSTSRDLHAKPTGTTETDETKQQIKSQKSKKRIAFEDHYDSHTTMPLSIVVPNFSVKLNKEISKYKALHISDAMPKRSGILFAPDSHCELGSGKCDTDGAGNKDSHGMEISAAEIDYEYGRSIPSNSNYRSQQTKSSFQQRKFSLYVLKYFKNLRSDSKHSRLNSHKSQKGSRIREADYSNLLPLLKSTNLDSLLEESKSGKMDEFIYPRMHEQIVFTRDLMKRPIRDVLKSYHNLREIDMKYSKHLERDSFSSILKGNKKIARQSRNLKCEKYLSIVSGLEKKRKNASHNETQVYFTEEGLRSYNSVERVSLACPKSDKMNSNRKNNLPPLYLFGNKEIGWSSMPVHFNDGNNPVKRSYTDTKYTSGLGLPFWEGQETIIRGDDNSSGMVISPDVQVTHHKKDSLFFTGQKTSIKITVKPSELCTTELDESCSKHTDSASLGEKIDPAPSPETWVMRGLTNPYFQGSSNNSHRDDAKSSIVESTDTDQKTGSCVFNISQSNKESLLADKMGQEKKKK